MIKVGSSCMMYTNKRKCDDMLLTNREARSPSRSQSAELLSEVSNDAWKLYTFSAHDYGESNPKAGAKSPSDTGTSKRLYQTAKRRINRSRDSNLDVDTSTTYPEECYCDQQPCYTSGSRLPTQRYRTKSTSPIWKSTPSLSTLATNNQYQPPPKEYFQQFDYPANNPINSRPMNGPTYRKVVQSRPWKERSVDYLQNATYRQVIIDPLSRHNITSPGIPNRYCVQRSNNNCVNPNITTNHRNFTGNSSNTGVTPVSRMTTTASYLSLEEGLRVNQDDDRDIPDSAKRLLPNENVEATTKLKDTSKRYTPFCAKSYKHMFYTVLTINVILILSNIIVIPLVFKFLHPGIHSRENCFKCDEMLLDDVESFRQLLVKSGNKCCLNEKESPYITILKIVNSFMDNNVQEPASKLKFPVMQYQINKGQEKVSDNKRRIIWSKQNDVPSLGFKMRDDSSEINIPKTGSYLIYTEVEYKKLPAKKQCKIGYSLIQMDFKTKRLTDFDRVEKSFTADQSAFSLQTCQLVTTYNFTESDKLVVQLNDQECYYVSDNTRIIMFYLSSQM